MIGIEDLRRDWRKQIKSFEKMIEALESVEIAKGQGLKKPTREWRTKLRVWRNELEQLLEQHPEKH